MPEARGFHFSKNAGITDADNRPTEDAASSGVVLGPFLAVHFESEAEARSCAQALYSFARDAVSKETMDNSAGVRDFTDVFSQVEPQYEWMSPGRPSLCVSDSPQVGTNLESSFNQSVWKAVVLSSASLKSFTTNTADFLQELDQLSGF